MILKGRTRADGGKLAGYLLSTKNEQVRILDVRGTVVDECSPDGLKQSLRDMDELGKMTRARSSLFHLAINPNDKDRMTPEMWQQSIAKAEKALGLEDQPRAVVSHTYQGKEHYHVVWSRVDVEQRKCVEMSFSNLKLCRAAREIELELGLQQTPERARGAHRLSQHIRQIEQHQDERAAQPREQLNVTLEKAWHQSKTGEEFKAQIETAGYQLAIGRRGVLVMDADNETHAIPRCVEGIKTRDVRAKLGDLEGLPTVEELRQARTRTSETARSDGPLRRFAEDMTAEQIEQEIPVPSPDHGDAGSSPVRREAQNLTADRVERALELSDSSAESGGTTMQEKTGKEFSDLIKQRQTGEISREQFMEQIAEVRKDVDEMRRVDEEIRQAKQREAERAAQIQNQIDRQRGTEPEKDLEP